MESMISRVVAAAALLIAGCRMFTCEPTMPEVDAANISGDNEWNTMGSDPIVPRNQQCSSRNNP